MTESAVVGLGLAWARNRGDATAESVLAVVDEAGADGE